MATFAYIARDSAGQKVEGKVAAATAQAVLAELQSRHLAPVRVEEVRDGAAGLRGLAGMAGIGGVSGRKRVSIRQLATAYRQLADLLRAGVPLLRALRLLGRSKSNPRLAKVMNDVADAVAEGTRLADAMAAHEGVFPPVQIAMVRAGERGGFLEPVLQRMAAFLEHEADMRSKVIGNLIYPVVLLVVMLSIIVIALVVFVPKFKDFYVRIELPLPTKIVLGASDLLSNYWLLVAVIAAGIVLIVWRLSRNAEVARRLALWRMNIPKLGPLLAGLAIGRFARILGTLLENGIPMLQAIQISRDAAGNILLEESIEKAGDAVRGGEALAKPLADSKLFPEDVVEMISVGESANNLPQVLITIADTIEKRTDRMLSMFVRLMEPALLLLMGSAVLFIFIALIVPIMRMSSSLSR